MMKHTHVHTHTHTHTVLVLAVKLFWSISYIQQPDPTSLLTTSLPSLPLFFQMNTFMKKMQPDSDLRLLLYRRWIFNPTENLFFFFFNSFIQPAILLMLLFLVGSEGCSVLPYPIRVSHTLNSEFGHSTLTLRSGWEAHTLGLCFIAVFQVAHHKSVGNYTNRFK